jgi:hypothetical protein
MSELSRETSVDFALPQAQADDLDLLAAYVAGPFRRRLDGLAAMQRRAPAYKFELAELLRKANFFHTELIGWLALAKREYTQRYADALAIEHSSESDRFAESRGLRPTAAMIQALARQELAPLEDVINRFEETVRMLDKIASSAQTMLRTMDADEFTGRAEGSGHDADWDDFQPAPIREALSRLRPGGAG